MHSFTDNLLSLDKKKTVQHLIIYNLTINQLQIVLISS